MKIKQKSVVLINYPFSSFDFSKVRPAIVISNDFFNGKSSDLIVVPLTTVLIEDEYSFGINQKDMAEGNLIKNSRVRVDKIFNIDKRLVIKEIGLVRDDVLKRINNILSNLFFGCSK